MGLGRRNALAEETLKETAYQPRAAVGVALAGLTRAGTRRGGWWGLREALAMNA